MVKQIDEAIKNMLVAGSFGQARDFTEEITFKLGDHPTERKIMVSGC